MLAHAASAQGISAVENMCGRPHELNHLSVPAACFTHPEVSFVGLTEEAAREAAAAGGFGSQVGVVKTSFKANSKARAGLLQLHARPDGSCMHDYEMSWGSGRTGCRAIV